jgi:hypothetical protein
MINLRYNGENNYKNINVFTNLIKQSNITMLRRNKKIYRAIFGEIEL